MVISTSLITFARGCWQRRCSFKLLMFHVKQLVVDLGRAMSGDVVGQLAETIAARRRAAADKSYTRQLLDAGPERCARKFGEEAIEAVIAGLAADPRRSRAKRRMLFIICWFCLKCEAWPGRMWPTCSRVGRRNPDLPKKRHGRRRTVERVG